MRKILGLVLVLLLITSDCYSRSMSFSFSSGSLTDAQRVNVAGGFGMTFYEDYEKGGSLDADFSLGSPTATFTWSTTNSTRTYVDSNGVIQIADTVNTPRFMGGYYNVNGFNNIKGLMIESASTNLITGTDGT